MVTRRNNPWTVINTNSWIVVTPMSGEGSQRLNYTVDPNADCASRVGTLSINGSIITIRQSSRPNSFLLSASNVVFTADAAAASVALSANCTWKVQADAHWISTISPASDNGEGDATIVYSVSENPTMEPRTGAIKILDNNGVVRQKLSVTQQGASALEIAFAPATATWAAEGGSGMVELIAPEDFKWSIQASKGLSIISPTNGTGSAVISYIAAPNPTDKPRVNSIVVVDANSVVKQTFSIVVAPALASYALSSTYLVFPSAGGNVSVGLSANASWSARSDVDWISSIAPANGIGNANIDYSVAPNTTSGSRIGSLQILDGNFNVRQTLRITQSGAAASFTISSTNANFDAGGGNGNLVLTANSSWRILVDVNWITGVSPLNGSGNASINYSVSPNTNSVARSSSIRILDGNFVTQKTIVITQEGASQNHSLVSATNSPAGFRWSATLGTSGDDVGTAVASDSQGNVFITGTIEGYPLVEKYSANGELIWSKIFYDNAGSGNAIAVDHNGNVVVAGAFYSSMDFGGGLLASAGEHDLFVVKYSGEGAHLWSKNFGGIEANDEARGLAIDSFGDVLVTGSVAGTVDFGGKISSPTGPLDDDILLAKFSAENGSLLWHKRFASTADDIGCSVIVGPQDEVVFTGNFSGPIDFGSAAATSNGGVIVAKFSSAGTALWSKEIGSAGACSGNSVAVDANGNIVLAGGFRGEIDFGAGKLFSSSANCDDVFLAKFAADGILLWSKSFGGTLHDGGNAVSFDLQGNVGLIGSFSDSLNLGGDVLCSAGGQDVFVAKYSPDGTHVWSKSFGSESGFDDGRALSIDPQGNLIGIGQFFATVDFGGGAQASTGSSDLFLVSLAP